MHETCLFNEDIKRQFIALLLDACTTHNIGLGGTSSNFVTSTIYLTEMSPAEAM